MLHFFRKMRKALIPESRFGRYFFYALGEIVLVVIGILIALQINNWNETRKEAIFERKMLNEILVSVQQNIDYLNLGINRNNEAIHSCTIILDHFEKGLPYSDSLDHHFSYSLQWFQPSITNNAYESLKSYGLHLIRNDLIRDQLGEIYEWKYSKVLNDRQDEYFFSTVSPMLVELFESNEFRGKMKPTDYQQLKNSKRYFHILNTLISNRKLQNEFWERIKNDRLRLAKLIETELNK